MKYILSLYSINFIRSLIYLLQKNEYIILDFVKLLFNIKDFSNVEVRSKLVLTSKVKIIYYFLEISRLIFLIFIIYNLVFQFSLGYFVWLLTLPLILVIELISISFILSLLQKPFEYYLIYKASNRLKNIKAIKIAISGSYGKTSMREILFTILKEGKKVATATENYNTPIGIANFVMSLQGDEEILIFEFGEYYKGDIRYLCEFVKPDIGIITGINEAHLDKFKNIENTISAIFELSDYLKNSNIYVNTDNIHVKENLRDGNISYSINGVEDTKVQNVSADLTGTKFDFNGTEFMTSLIGVHNVGPIALVIHIAKKNFTLNTLQIKNGVGKIKPFKNRLEIKKLSGDILLLDDTYNGNIDGFLVTLDFLNNINDRRIVYITPGLVETGNKKEFLHKQIGNKIAEVGIKNVVLIRNSATPFIEIGLKESKYEGNLMHFDSMLDVLSKLSTFTLSGDLVIMQNDWADQYY